MTGDGNGSPLGVRWGPHMTVGFDELDADHASIIEALNALVEAHDRHLGRDQVDRLFDALMSTVLGHFAREERVMTESGYPGLSYHAGEHQRLRQRLEQLQAGEIHETDETMRADVRAFLTNWLYGHVLVDDFAYRGHLHDSDADVHALLAQPVTPG